MPLHTLTDDERRSHCRREIEALEHWLRRLVHETFSEAYGPDYLDATGGDGNPLFKPATAMQIKDRHAKEPSRFPRLIDATHLDDLVKVICKPENYKRHFEGPLGAAFPEGHQEARTFLDRITGIRHKLSHANPISVHEAMRAICYSQDVLASLKEHYAAMNKEREYSVPTFIRVSDSMGNVCHGAEIRRNSIGAGYCYFADKPSGRLHPGDRLSIEVEVDPTFDRSSYRLEWTWRGNKPDQFADTACVIVHIETSMVHPEFLIYCEVISNRDWHKMGEQDDRMEVYYKVLPPSSDA